MNVPSGQALRGVTPARPGPSAPSASRDSGTVPSPNRAALRAFAVANAPVVEPLRGSAHVDESPNASTPIAGETRRRTTRLGV